MLEANGEAKMRWRKSEAILVRAAGERAAAVARATELGKMQKATVGVGFRDGVFQARYTVAKWEKKGRPCKDDGLLWVRIRNISAGLLF
jgi:hypothetical protein